MFRKLVKATEIEIDGQPYAVRYFEQRTVHGSQRFSCEVLLDAADRIIVDDDSLTSLESKVARLAPATIYSRLLAATRSGRGIEETGPLADRAQAAPGAEYSRIAAHGQLAAGPVGPARRRCRLAAAVATSAAEPRP